ncbi:MAG: hypothetical protein DRG27_06475 [Deltaproteobacteria bacterium]|nr:MAG: hypothetical protein DRG27_06475 [Deltaproteobacteria bacterium]
MQESALQRVFMIEQAALESKNKELIDMWRKLQTSDNFYYMCTKYFNDGDVHKYFNPYDTPYDAFITFMNILNDMMIRLKSPLQEKGKGETISLNTSYLFSNNNIWGNNTQ